MSNAIDIPVPARETWIPAFTPKHDDLLSVRGRNGKHLGFTVGQTLPERRFALNNDGKCLDARDFEPLYIAWCSRVSSPDGRIIAIASVNKYFDPRLENIPNPEEFVNARELNGRILPITFDDKKVEMQRGSDDRKYNAQGEIATAANTKAHLADRSALAKVEVLRQLVSDGVLTDAQFVDQVSKLVAAPAEEAIAIADSELPAGFDAVIEEDAPLVPEEGAKAPPIIAAPCGKSGFRMEHFMRQHISYCKSDACSQARLRNPEKYSKDAVKAAPKETE